MAQGSHKRGPESLPPRQRQCLVPWVTGTVRPKDRDVFCDVTLRSGRCRPRHKEPFAARWDEARLAGAHGQGVPHLSEQGKPAPGAGSP